MSNPVESAGSDLIEKSDLASLDSQRYNGFDNSADKEIHQIARQLSRSSFKDGNSSSEALSRTSTSFITGVNPINDPNLDSRLDPNSADFNSKYWIKNFRKLQDQDPDYYKSYSLGITFKDLRAFGNATDTDYQTTVINAPFKVTSNFIRKLLPAKDENLFDILKPMDALIEPGEVVVVLGRPGSGCSTLLKSIGSNTHGFHIDPESKISYEGLSPSDVHSHYRGEVVYNGESDIHFPHLTVWETLSLAAKFRTPQNRIPGVSREDYANSLTEVYMATYGLSHTKNTKVGNELVRGVSGGERKRVSIAEVSLSGARLQCWDNATRGLDAATALEFIRALRSSADILDTTAVIAIYQCSQDAYDLFDKVSLLYEGYQIYFGRADEAKEYFERMGYACPPRQTTADFLTSVTSPIERVTKPGFENRVPKTPVEFETYWKSSPEYANLIDAIDKRLESFETANVRDYIKSAHNAKQSNNIRKTSSYTVSFWMQTKYCLKREFQRIRNDLGFNLFQSIANSIMALILSSIFYNLPSVTSSFRDRSSAMFLAVLFNGFSSFLEIMLLFESRPIVEKHKQYALYHPSAASLASVIAQIPFKIFVALAFNLVYYFMINFRREPGRFFFYLLVNLMATFTMSHFFRLVGSAASSLPEALVPAQMVLLALVIFVGFTIPVDYMLGWSRWLNYIDPLAYAFEALLVNEFHGEEYDCSDYIPANPFKNPGMNSDSFVCTAVSAVAGQTKINGDDYLASAYSYKNSNKWRNFGIVTAFAIALLIGYLVFAEFNESAKQKGEILLFQRSKLKSLKKSNVSLKSDIEAGRTEKETINQEVDEDHEISKTVSKALNSSSDIFHWRNVHFNVKIKKEDRAILNGIDGWVKPGTLTALMGATGAGKTSLLDVLANRVTTGVVTGDMFVNGKIRDSSFQRSTGYVQQQDLHLETATVREALRFSAYLRQPSDVSKAEKDDYVEEVIKILDMEKYSDAVVGVPGEGLNVEQRKRLTIGVELAARPHLLLFLDEPTSGLDSQTAWSICQLMRKLADHGQAILCTIHQPSSILMQEFDRLLFLAKGGRTVYFGDLGKNCQTLIDYFESKGANPCPVNANPAEWMLHVIGAAPGSHTDKDYHKIWLESHQHYEVLQELDRLESELVSIPAQNASLKGEFAASLWTQYIIVTKRVFQEYYRSPSFIWSKMFLAISSSMFIGFSFFKAKNSMQGLQNQALTVFMFVMIYNPLVQQILPRFVAQRDLYETRERPSKTFSWKVFMAAQITAEIPWNAFVGTISFLVFYYPAGFYRNSTPDEVHIRGFYAWIFSVMFFIFCGTVAHIAIAPMELALSAGNLSSLCFTLSLAFCGVLVGPKTMPGFWIFMYRVTPFTYVIDGFLSNAVAHAKVVCSANELVKLNPPFGQTCGEYLESYLTAAGTGYLIDSSATENCQICSISTTDDFLKSSNLSYSTRWRNFGILIAYIGFNILGAFFFYWLARVPKKTSRVKNEKKNKSFCSNDSQSQSQDSTVKS